MFSRLGLLNLFRTSSHISDLLDTISSILQVFLAAWFHIFIVGMLSIYLNTFSVPNPFCFELLLTCTQFSLYFNRRSTIPTPKRSFIVTNYVKCKILFLASLPCIFFPLIFLSSGMSPLRSFSLLCVLPLIFND